MLPVLSAILADRPVAAYVVSGRGAFIDLVGAFPGTYSISAGAVTAGVLPGFECALGLVSGGVNGGRSTANAPASMLGDPTFSIEHFLLPRAIAGTLALNGWGTTGVALKATGLWHSGGVLRCEYAGGNSAVGPASALLTVNRVNHVVYTKTPGAIAANSKFYVDGRDTGTCTGSANTPNIGASPFSAGQWADFGGSSADAVHQIVAFYDKILSPASIVRHLNASQSVGRVPNRIRMGR